MTQTTSDVRKRIEILEHEFPDTWVIGEHGTLAGELKAIALNQADRCAELEIENRDLKLQLNTNKDLAKVKQVDSKRLMESLNSIVSKWPDYFQSYEGSESVATKVLLVARESIGQLVGLETELRAEHDLTNRNADEMERMRQEISKLRAGLDKVWELAEPGALGRYSECSGLPGGDWLLTVRGSVLRKALKDALDLAGMKEEIR
jgi:hypothetical protein